MRPEMPLEGVIKPPGYGPNTPGSQRLIAIGRENGINFTYKSAKFPNTVQSHCSLEYALEKDPTGKKQNQLQELLFETYFTDGAELCAEKISQLAAVVGLDSAEVKSFITDPDNMSKVKEKASAYSANGVNGVPAFIMNGKLTFSGAQGVENFIQMFDLIVKQTGDAALL